MTTYFQSQDGKTISRGFGATNDSPPTQGGGWAVISPQERPNLYPQGAPANIGTPELTLPGMSATGNTPTTTPAPTLPTTSDTGSLVGFKDNMARVMSLAEAKRNDLLKQFMMPSKGTMQASDFTSLFDNFTTQSDLSNKTILEKLIPKPDTQIITETDASGRTTAITFDKNTGKVVNKVNLGVIGKPSSANEPTVQDKENTAFKIINQLTGMKNAKGQPYTDAQGYFTPSGFKDLIKNAVEDGITREKFIKQYGDKFSPTSIDSYGLTQKEKTDLTGY